MTSFVTVENLSLRIGVKTLLHDISFTIPRASIYALLGPNGAGKTLLLRCLVGLSQPTRGRVTRVAPTLAWVPLSQALPFHFRVRELVQMGRYGLHQGFVQRQDEAAVEQAMARVGVQGFATRTYNSLSRGEQTKVDVARALASEAELILLDEPFSNLDIDSTLHMIALFQGLRDEGKTLVLSHHDLYTVSELADHALLLKQGHLLTQGLIADVFHSASIEAAYNVKATFRTEGDKRFVRFESLKPYQAP